MRPPPAARRSAPPHDGPSATGRAPRHGAGIRPPEGRHVPSAHIRARLAPVVYRSSFVVVVSGQWCTHCDTGDNRRLVAIKNCVCSLTKSWRTPRIITHADETTKLHPISKIWLAKCGTPPLMVLWTFIWGCSTHNINRANSTTIQSPRMDPAESPTDPRRRDYEDSKGRIKKEPNAQALCRINLDFFF